jgi:hypothetical protein
LRQGREGASIAPIDCLIDRQAGVGGETADVSKGINAKQSAQFFTHYLIVHLHRINDVHAGVLVKVMAQRAQTLLLLACLCQQSI